MDLKNYAIYLDMDGVLADFDEGIRRLGFKPDPLFNQSSHAMDDEANLWKQGMYDVIKGTTFFETLPFMPGAVDLYKAVAEAEPIILTASPKFGASEDDYLTAPFFQGAAYAKRRWIEETLLAEVFKVPYGMNDRDGYVTPRRRIPDERFICTTSSRKQLFMHRKHSDHQILIDDRTANCNAWIDAGGFAIYHTSAQDTIARLAEYVESKAA
ncbi:hypothetical protein D869_gp216 [Caulobacter phage CcrRogue]|uniref:Uncharacterized protein n=1 Tax=Caulobacter phage CcrRogue TaxID=2927986 RepID=K4JSH6_9CAUD|nr:hypothetical protein D869_gp216 [Caulobacter phage CcrRogue]AFU86698.1 hypothetical protein CcrRogue_gp216 [Caulobacter phage CcrRogue]